MKYRCFGFIMALGMVFNFGLKADAATSGYKGTTTMNVTTKSNWSVPGAESITLQNSPVKIQYNKVLSGKNKTYTENIYPVYRVKVIRVIDNKVYANKTLNTSTLKINLERDKSYRVTVSYDDQATWLKMIGFGRSGQKMIGTPYWSLKSATKSTCR